MFELKEKAKWSYNGQEKRLAITGMLSHGPEALSSLEEILSVSAYEEIRAACIDAIKSIRANMGSKSPMDAQISENSVAFGPDTTATASDIKKKGSYQSDADLVASNKLADLPP